MLVKSLLSAVIALSCSAAFAGLASDANVTPGAIWGSGNVNGGYQVFTDPATGLELGLRARVRYPEPTAVTNVSGNTYTHQAGLAGPSLNRAFWNFDYSVNTNYNGSGTSFDLAGLTFVIGIDSNPAGGGVAGATPFAVFNAMNWGDTTFGTNATANGAGTPALSPIVGTNVGQNSLNYGFFPGLQLASNNFAAGEYLISLGAFRTSDLNGAGINPAAITVADLPTLLTLTSYGSTAIVVNAVPEPTAALFGTLLASGLGMTIARRRRDEEIA